MKNAEIMLLLASGLEPMDIVRMFGYPTSTVYNWRRIYRKAGIALAKRIRNIQSFSPRGKKRVNNLDALKDDIALLGSRELIDLKKFITRKIHEVHS